MKVEDGKTADTFIVSGRGTLHITILIENMLVELICSRIYYLSTVSYTILCTSLGEGKGASLW